MPKIQQTFPHRGEGLLAPLGSREFFAFVLCFATAVHQVCKAFWALGIQQRRRYRRAKITVEVMMRHPVADTGACFPAVKAAIDGLVDAGVLPGDTGQFVPSITFLAPVRVGKDQVETLTLVLEPDDRPE